MKTKLLDHKLYDDGKHLADIEMTLSQYNMENKHFSLISYNYKIHIRLYDWSRPGTDKISVNTCGSITTAKLQVVAG